MRGISTTVAALLVLVSSLQARAQESPFRADCSLYMERELSQVPFDNAAKYGSMLVAAGVLWETAPAMGALAREEAVNDVKAALLRGAALCLKDPEHRELANKAIAIRKATKDWSGFETDLLKIANMQPKELYQKVVLAPGLFDDLESGGGTFAELVSVRREIMSGRKPSFQADLKAKQKLAEIFGDSCLPESAEAMITDMHAAMDAREDPATRDMVLASQALTGRMMSLDDILAFNAAPYIGSNASQASRFIGARGDYRLIQELRPWADQFLDKVKEEAPKHQALVRRLTLHLRDADQALKQCNQPRMVAAMQLVSREPGVLAANPIHRLISLISGETDMATDAELRLQVPAKGKDACYGGVVAQYNDLVEDYLRLKEVNVPGRDAERFMNLMENADRSAQACKADQAEQLLDQAYQLVPASLDPGNLCLNADQAQRSYARREAETRSRLQSCQAAKAEMPMLTYSCEQQRGAMQFTLMKKQQKVCTDLRAQHSKTGKTKCNCCYSPDNVLKGCFLWETTEWVKTPDGKQEQKPVPLTKVPE